MPDSPVPSHEPTPPLAVTAAVLWRAGRILIARRTRPAWLAGAWEFPGGKTEPGERPEDGLARELREELAIEARVGALLLRTRHDYPELAVELSTYEAQWVSGEPRAREHDAWAWVAVEDLAAYPLAAADLPIVAHLVAAARPRAGGGDR